MEQRFSNSPAETRNMHSKELRDTYLIENLMQPGKVNLVYSHYDRMIIGGIVPKSEEIDLPNHAELRADFFLQRREAGFINVGGSGIIIADGEEYQLNKLDALYTGKGVKNIIFKSVDSNQPAYFYMLSAPAHQSYPIHKLKKEDASPMTIGSFETANERTIYKYIHLAGITSCQLVMGLTVLHQGSVWNTMPSHTHTRRMEVYFYFDVIPEHRVLHLMGEPKETRHLIVANHEAVISPPWSIHSGCGTANYGFIWGMAGENLVYTDMDPAPIKEMY